MSASTIFVFAIVVFFLMVTGIFLSMREFNRITDEPSQQKGVAETMPPSRRGIEAADTA